MNALVDPETGQPFFKPAINESSRKIVNSREQGYSYEHLYKAKKKATQIQPDENSPRQDLKNPKSE